MNLNELYMQAINGDEKSEREMFKHLSDSFRVLIRHKVQNREDGEDIVQKILGSIAENFKSVKINTSFSAWVYQIYNNKIKDYYRWKNAQPEKESIQETADSRSNTPAYDTDFTRGLETCFEQLLEVNPQYGKILKLRYQGFEIAEICEMLDMTKNAVYLVLSRARKILRECLNKKGIM